MHNRLSPRSLLPLALLFLLLAGAAAQADDFNPPSWRGQPGSTYQMWTFDNLPDFYMGEPSISRNPYGGALILSWYKYTPGSGYIEASALDIFVPNSPENKPYKLIRLQLTFRLEAEDPVPYLDVDIDSTSYKQWQLIDAGMPAANQGWADFLVWPNPNEEIISLASHYSSPIKWDQIVIDTWCTSTLPSIPEPVFLQFGALLGLSGLGLLRRCKR